MNTANKYETTLLICPNCSYTLYRDEKHYFCNNNHCFDIAKQGYVNLLLSQQSSKKRHGDDSLMVQSRRSFLDKGYYDCLCNSLTNAAVRYSKENTVLLDAGCGEGYYTSRVCEAIRNSGRECEAIGIDISKSAVSFAARRDPGITFVTAGVNQIPVADGTTDVVMNVFAPLATREYGRILKEGGILLRAVPLERHLMGLKEKIYDNVFLNKSEDNDLEGFILREKIEVNHLLHLDNNDDIMRLFMMTPYYYKTSRKDQEKIEKLHELTTELCFAVLVYQKD